MATPAPGTSASGKTEVPPPRRSLTPRPSVTIVVASPGVAKIGNAKLSTSNSAVTPPSRHSPEDRSGASTPVLSGTLSADYHDHKEDGVKGLVTFFKAAKQPLTTVLRLAVPMSVSQLAQFSIMLVMLAVVGHMGVGELGGASIAFGLINATGFAFGSGICGALETLLSQSFGRDQTSKMYGVYAQRMLVILFIFMIPLIVLLLSVNRLLLLIGEPESVAYYAGRFCEVAALSIPPIMVLELLRRYYASQRLPNPIFVALLLAAVANPFLLHACVENLGYDGVAAAWSLLMTMMDVGLVLYLVVTGLYRRTWGGWSRGALQDWGPMLKLALPSLGMAVSEWTAMEVNSVFAGFGTQIELAAYAVSSQISSVCWAVAAGIFIASTVLVGNCIGAGHPSAAKQYAKLCAILAVTVATVNMLILYVSREWLVSRFTDDERVIDQYSELVPYVMLYHLLDTLQCTCLGIMRGCGLQAVGMAIVIVGLACVGTPLGIFLFLKHGVGIKALWLGPIVGLLFITMPCYFYVFFRHLNWNHLKAQDESLSSGVVSEDTAKLLVAEGSVGTASSTPDTEDLKCLVKDNDVL